MKFNSLIIEKNWYNICILPLGTKGIFIMAKKKFKLKQLPWGLICFGVVTFLNLALILDYSIMELVGEAHFEEVGFNNFLIGFTYTCDIIYMLCHAFLLFFKKRQKSMLSIMLSGGALIVFYIIKFCLEWF